MDVYSSQADDLVVWSSSLQQHTHPSMERES
jgi:hypothetical protein